MRAAINHAKLLQDKRCISTRDINRGPRSVINRDINRGISTRDINSRLFLDRFNWASPYRALREIFAEINSNR